MTESSDLTVMRTVSMADVYKAGWLPTFGAPPAGVETTQGEWQVAPMHDVPSTLRMATTLSP